MEGINPANEVGTQTPTNLDVPAPHHAASQDEELGSLNNEVSDEWISRLLERLDWLQGHDLNDPSNLQSIETNMDAALTELEQIDWASRSTEEQNFHKAILSEFMKIGVQFRSQSKVEGLNVLGFEFRLRDQYAMLVAEINVMAAGQLLAKLALMHLDQYKHVGTPGNLVCAIECHARSISLGAEGVEELAVMLRVFGTICFDKFDREGMVQDIERAIDCNTYSVSLTPEDHPDMSSLLNNLGIAHIRRFERLEETEDIENAIECQTRALALTHADHPRALSLLGNLGVAYIRRFDRLEDMKDMDKAIECQDRVVLLTPKDHPDMSSRLSNLGTTYLRRFERLGCAEDMDKAIEYQTRAMSLASKDNPDMPALLDSLGNAHQAQFERLRRMKDIDEAIKYHTRAVQLSTQGHPQMPISRNALGCAHQRRFKQLGMVEDLNQSIEHYTFAVEHTPPKHPYMPTWLNNLGNSYSWRFERLGRVEDVDKAIEYQARAVSLTPEGHPELPGRLDNLGIAHQRRFGRFGRANDIDKAIEFQTRAVSLIPERHNDRPSLLTNLGNAHHRRSTQPGKEPEELDMNKAIECHSQALLLTPPGDPNIPSRQNNLGVAYQFRFEQVGDMTDLDKAIECHADAVKLTLKIKDDPHMPGRLNNLGSAYHCRFERLGEMEDLDRAIEYQTRAMSLMTPAAEGHPNIPSILHNLGHSHYARFQSTGDVQALDQSLEYFQQCSHTTGSPLTRFRAARIWAEITSTHKKSDCISAFQTAMNLVPKVIWLGETISQRYKDVQTIGDTVLQAAAAAIDAKKFDLAIEWLEQGRSIVWSQALQLRNPFNELYIQHRELADNLRQLSDQLHNASSSFSGSDERPRSLEEAAQEHRQLAGQYEDLLTQIRALPGFETFLRPNKLAELLPAVQTGPLVVINVYKSRCDALVLLPGKTDIRHIPLLDLTAEKVANALNCLQRTLERHGLRDGRKPDMSVINSLWRNEFPEMLATLWTAIVKPVLNSLGYLRHGLVEQLPHITWCTTGALSLLPLHAAGCYDQAEEKLFDYAISSYTPTISALLQGGLANPAAHSRILAVGQEDTPEKGSLPGTTTELDAIEACTRPPLNCTRLESSDATCEAVLDAIEQHDWVHLACHAHQNVHDPTESGFFLHDKMLSLATIIQKSFKNKGLAFLSACETATGDEKIADEAVHLASGMLMGGYPSVIATMWPVKDSDAPIIAREVYRRLLKEGRMDHRDAARALHEAVAHLRAQPKVGDKALERWAPYIHIGV